MKLKKIIELTNAEYHSSSEYSNSECSLDEILINGVKNLNSASENDISFYFPTSKRAAAENLELAYKTKAKVLFLSEKINDLNKVQLIVKNPMLAIIKLAEIMRFRPSFGLGIHSSAVISDTAKVSKSARIGPNCVVGDNCIVEENCILHSNVVLYPNVELGKECEIHAGAVIRENVILGDDCLIQGGAVIGGEGFGYIPDKEQGHRRIPHIGKVFLDNRVDVGSNSSVDRGTLGDTKLGEATKLDSLVQIGHNNQIGKRVLVCAMSGIGGSGSIGDDSVIGGHVGIADHIKITSRVRLAGKTGVSADITEPGDYMGAFYAEPVRQFWRQLASLKSLPKVLKEIKKKL